MQVPYESEGARDKVSEREHLNSNKQQNRSACLFPTPLNVFSLCNVCLIDNWHYLIDCVLFA